MSIVSRKKRGFGSERELVERFRELGLWSIRIPASGVGVPIPDVLVFHNGHIYGFEVKSTNKKKAVYYYKDFDNALEWLHHMLEEGFRVKAWLAVRFKGGIWRFYELNEDSSKVECDPNSGFGILDLSKELRNLGRKFIVE